MDPAAIMVFVVGLFLGTLLNLVIVRMPRERELGDGLVGLRRVDVLHCPLERGLRPDEPDVDDRRVERRTCIATGYVGRNRRRSGSGRDKACDGDRREDFEGTHSYLLSIRGGVRPT